VETDELEHVEKESVEDIISFGCASILSEAKYLSGKDLSGKDDCISNFL
jgi:hypothetical protein